MKRILILLLICLAFVPSLVLADLSPFSALQGFHTEMDSFIAVASVNVKTHMPYSDERLSWLNALLSHVDLMMASADPFSVFAIRVDGKEALRTEFAQRDGEMFASFSCLPDQVFRIQDQSWLPAETNSEMSLYGLDGSEHDRQDQWFDFLITVPSLFSETVKTSAVNSRISGYGTVREKKVVTIPAKDAAALSELPGIPNDALVFQGKQVYTLLSDEDGNPVKLVYSGTCGSQTDPRNVSLTWLHSGKNNKITLKTPTADRKKRNNLVLEEKVQKTGDTERWQCDFRYETLENKVKTVLNGDVDLSCSETDKGPVVTGNVELKRTSGNNSSERMVLTPELLLTSENWSGQLGVTIFEGKSEKENAVLYLDISEGVTLPELSSSGAVTMDNAAMERLSSAMISALIRPLVLLPEEDTQFLSYELPEGIWKAIMEMAADPKEVSE